MTYLLSIFVLYSPSRRRQFEQFSRLLARCNRYQDCQKLLVCDDKTDVYPDDYETIIVPRQGPHFCWSDAWASAMAAVESEKVLYLDCDRILPEWYLERVIDTLKDHEFVYPQTLWNLQCDVPDEVLLSQEMLLTKYKAAWRSERLTAEYIYLPCRGPLSGTTAFTARTYRHVGPLDRSYVAWGYPDIEYQEMAKSRGCVFRPIDCEVLHLSHSYEIDPGLFYKVNAWNGVRFFKKWKLPYTSYFKKELVRREVTDKYLLSVTLDKLIAEHVEKPADDDSHPLVMGSSYKVQEAGGLQQVLNPVLVQPEAVVKG